jgi:hypothetical protein
MKREQPCEVLDRTNRHKVIDGRNRRVECRDAFDRHASTGPREKDLAQPSRKDSERSESLLRFPPQKDFERGNSIMSAIGITGTPSAFKKRRPILIGAHADYRPQDFYFSRTQSLPMRDAEWESRIKPMHSWSEIALYSTGLFVLFVVGLSFA